MRHRRALFMMLPLLAGPLTAQAARPWSVVDSLAQRLIDGHFIPGVALAAVDRDGTLHELAAGYADVDSHRPVEVETPFYIASSTKSFTALAAAMLAEQGTWKLTDPIAKYLPGAEWHREIDPSTITLEALLSHTSGLDNNGPVVIRAAYTGDIDRPDMLRSLAFHGPASTGRAFAYSNLGYNIVSLAIDSIVGPWQDVLRDKVFAPLGLHHTTARMSDVPVEELAMPHTREPDGLARSAMEKTDNTMHAAGGIVTTVGDLERWVRVQLDHGRIDGKQVFPAAVIDDTHRPRSSFSIDFLEIDRVGYGLGWYTGLVNGDTLIHHFGGFAGYAAHISFKPHRGTGVVVLVNGGFDVESMELLAELAYAVASGDAKAIAREQARADSVVATFPARIKRIRADRERRAARPQQLPLPMDAYVGEYHSPELGELRIVRWGDSLRLVLGQIHSAIEGYDVASQQVRFEISAGSGMVGTFTVRDGRAAALEVAGIRFERVGS